MLLIIDSPNLQNHMQIFSLRTLRALRLCVKHEIYHNLNLLFYKTFSIL